MGNLWNEILLLILNSIPSPCLRASVSNPVPKEAKAFFDRNFTSFWEKGGFTARPAYSSTGNFAFEEYRKRELERLEEERRRLDEEAHAFAEFVEELKRAKDRDEFDAFMAKRRGGQGPAA